MEVECNLVPVWMFDDEDFVESDTEFYCTECGEYVDGPCEQEGDL